MVHEAQGENVVLSRPAVGDRIPGLWFPGTGQPVLVVHPDGAAAARKQGAVEKLLAAKRPVLLIDAFQTGAAKAPRGTGQHFLTFNRTDDALRVQDVITAVKWLTTQAPGSTVEVIGAGKAAVWSRFAAAAIPVKVTLQAPVDPMFKASDDELAKDFYVPHIQRVGGWKTAMQLTAR